MLRGDPWFNEMGMCEAVADQMAWGELNPNVYLYGVGPLDDQSAGITFDMKAGDIAVHAAGVTHKNLESSDDYEYVGLYPKDAPHWDNNLCKADTDETRLKAEAAKEVAIPDHDPIYGLDGPLPRIWKSVT